WLDVLVHAKEIIGIVFVFDGDQAFVIIAIGSFHAPFSFVAHQEVHVRPAGGVRMYCVVITLGPRNDFVLIRGIGVNAHDYLCPVGIAIIPGGIIFADPCCGAVNWIHVHGGMHRWEHFTKANMLRNGV